MRCIFMLLSIYFLVSCWKINGNPYPVTVQAKVWGSKPVYASEFEAKRIFYDSAKDSIKRPGNIYAYGDFIFQIDIGRGIHVIDNTRPVYAERVGFINLGGCEQISIKGSYLYTNSYTDLVTLDISDPAKLHLVSTIQNAFPEYLSNYPMAAPEESGYYECPRIDSLVIGWVKDSVYMNCFKN